MNRRNVNVTITVQLGLVVDADVNEELLRRYVDKAVDNGLDMGLGSGIGVDVVSQHTDIQL